MCGILKVKKYHKWDKLGIVIVSLCPHSKTYFSKKVISVIFKVKKYQKWDKLKIITKALCPSQEEVFKIRSFLVFLKLKSINFDLKNNSLNLVIMKKKRRYFK